LLIVKNEIDKILYCTVSNSTGSTIVNSDYMALRLSITHFGRFFLMLLFLAFSATNVSAQSVYEEIGRLPITTYTAEDYGGDPLVRAAIQSKEGLMYFGTDFGLHEYDGVSWRSLFKNTEVQGIFGFAKDTKGRIFYAGRDFGYLETSSTGETKVISLVELIPEELSGNDFFSVHCINGYVFLQTRNHLIRVELDAELKLKSLKSWPTETRFTRGYLVGDQYTVCQIEKGLFRLEGDDLQLLPNTAIFGKDPLAFMFPFPGKEDRALLLGGRGTGFYSYEENTLRPFATELDDLMEEGFQLNSAIRYKENILVGLSGSGLVMMSPQGKILKKVAAAQGLPSNVVKGLFLDQTGGLWVTTEDGIARIDIDSPILRFGKESGVTTGVNSIEKKGEELYLATTAGLIAFDPKAKSFQPRSELNTGQVLNLWTDGTDLIIPGDQLQVLRGDRSILLDGPEDGSRSFLALIPKNSPNQLFVSSTSGLLVYQRGLSAETPWEYIGKAPNTDKKSIASIFDLGNGNLFLSSGLELIILSQGELGLETVNLNKIKTKSFEIDDSKVTVSMVDGEFFMFDGEKMQKYSEEEKFVTAEEFSAVESELFDFNQHKSGLVWYQSKDLKKHLLTRNSDGKYVKDEKPNAITPYLSQVDFID